MSAILTVPPDRMPREFLAAIARLLHLPRAWANAAECEQLGITSDVCRIIESMGWLERWEHRNGRLWTLTPYATFVFKVQVGEHWERQGDGSYLEIADWRPITPESERSEFPWPTPLGLRRDRRSTVVYPNNMLEYVKPPAERTKRGREREQATDPVSGQPMTLFGGHPVYRDDRIPLGQKPPPKRPRRKASA